ncbi:MAG: hypothetical protein ACSHXJ_00700 [Marinomonas colpomeniae]
MDLSLFIKKIIDLEKAINISEIKCFDFNPWPYIRLKILEKNNSVDKSSSEKIKLKTMTKFKNFLRSFLIYRKKPVKNEHADVIYFTRLSESEDLIDGINFNRYADSFKYFFSIDYKIKVLELSDIDWVGSKKYTNLNITYLDFIIKLTKIKFNIFARFKNFNKTEDLDFNKAIEEKFDFKISLNSELIYLNMLSKVFMKILKCYKPKIVVLTVFYRLEAMAMCLACERLGIKTIDYQHGAQNDYHPMYTHWENIPQKGYELIPDIFWMWGDIPKKRIESWAMKSKKHTAIVGGNLWMTYLSQRKSTVENIGMFYQKNRTHILISLQGDAYFPSFLLGAIANSSSDVVWHFRDHPRLAISKELRKSIAQYENTEIEFTSQAPLYELLKLTDVHLTGYSTVAFEAQSFYVPTIFMHVNSLNGYKSLMNKNGLYYVENESDLICVLGRLINESPYITPDYIVSDLAISRTSLSSILDSI